MTSPDSSRYSSVQWAARWQVLEDEKYFSRYRSTSYALHRMSKMQYYNHEGSCTKHSEIALESCKIIRLPVRHEIQAWQCPAGCADLFSTERYIYCRVMPTAIMYQFSAHSTGPALMYANEKTFSIREFTFYKQ